MRAASYHQIFDLDNGCRKVSVRPPPALSTLDLLARALSNEFIELVGLDSVLPTEYGPSGRQSNLVAGIREGDSQRKTTATDHNEPKPDSDRDYENLDRTLFLQQLWMNEPHNCVSGSVVWPC